MPDSTPPSPTLEPGTVLDRYELLCTIARGGMAHVWLGRFKGKHGFEKLVAVKTILPEHALDERFRNMFLDEARIAAGVEHPNVAKILDLGEWRDCLYLVMEYVDGDSLSRLRRSVEKRGMKLPLPLTLRMLADTCAGLHAAHDLRGEDNSLLNVVHRDVSPQNVLIPTNGVAKLIDFGVAKARHRLGEETSAGFAKGKSRYMSPEQALSKPVDRRADLFAIGAMAYEIFEGNAPYDGPNDMARLHALLTGVQIKSVKNADPIIEKIIVKALAREADERYATANELRVALEDAMVQLKMRASADDVAAFVSENTKERIVERKRVVKVALDAAAERQRIKDMLAEGTLSGRRENLSAPDLLSPASDISLPAPAALPTDAPPVESAPPAFSASVHEDPHGNARRKRIAMVAGAVLFGATLLVVAFAMRGEKTSATQPPPPAMSVATAAPSQAEAANIPPPAQTTSATMVASAPTTSTTTSAAGTTKPAPTVRHTTPTSTTKPHGKNTHEVVIQ